LIYQKKIGILHYLIMMYRKKQDQLSIYREPAYKFLIKHDKNAYVVAMRKGQTLELMKDYCFSTRKLAEEKITSLNLLHQSNQSIFYEVVTLIPSELKPEYSLLDMPPIFSDEQLLLIECMIGSENMCKL